MLIVIEASRDLKKEYTYTPKIANINKEILTRIQLKNTYTLNLNRNLNLSKNSINNNNTKVVAVV